MSGDTKWNPSDGKTGQRFKKQRSNSLFPFYLCLPSVVFKTQLSLFHPLCGVMPLIVERAGRVSLSMNILEAGGRDGATILGGPESGLARVRAEEEIRN